MSAEVFDRAMGLQGDWIVDVWESRGGEIEVLVEPPRESLRCRACRSRRVHVHERTLQSWRDTPISGKPVLIVMPPARSLPELRSEDVASAEVCLGTEAAHEEH